VLMVIYIMEMIAIPDNKAEFDLLLIYNFTVTHSRILDFMTTPPITLTKDATMADAKALMRDHKISGIPIVDKKGLLIGIVSLENIIIALEKNQINDPIEKHMKKNVIKLFYDMDASALIKYLMTHGYGRYPVVDRNSKVVGVVTNEDVMQHMYDRLGSIYMHNKRRDKILTRVKPSPRAEASKNDHYFSYYINSLDIDQAGQGSALFKKFLQERKFPSDATRRASISLYEAEVNVVLHANGKGRIKAILTDNQISIIIVDKGPGINDIDLAMQPGYTTASDEVRERGFGAGMGLANIQKYTDKLVILSSNKGLKVEMVITAKDQMSPQK